MKRKFHCRTNESPLFTVESIKNLTFQIRTCQLSRFSRDPPSFSSNLPVRPPNLPGNTYRYYFRYFRDVKKENKT